MFPSRYSFCMAVLIIFLIVAPPVSTQAGDSYSFNEGSVASIITAIPRSMAYQAVLYDSDGDPVRNTTLYVTFRLFDALEGGNQLWTDSVEVTTDNGGNFTAVLSNLNLPFDRDYYLELQLEGDPQPLSPRQKLHMVPYSARTDTSECTINVIDNAITSAKIANSSIQFSDIGQNGATDGQVIKWSGGSWIAGNDETGVARGGYDSGWFNIAPSNIYELWHNLGTDRFMVTIWVKNLATGYISIPRGAGSIEHDPWDHIYGVVVCNPTTNTIRVTTTSNLDNVVVNPNNAQEHIPADQARIILLALE